MGYTYQQLQQMGATPVAKKGKTLEELKAMGATNPNEFPKQEPETVKQGFFSRLGAATKKTFTEDIPGAVSDVVGGVGNVAKGVYQDYKQGGQDITNSVTEAGSGQQNPLSAGLQTAGTVAKTAFSPITRSIQTATGAVAEEASKLKAVQNFANSKAGVAVTDIANNAEQKYSEWAIQHPEASKNLEASLNIGSLLLGSKAEPVVKNSSISAVQKSSNILDIGLKKTKAVSETLNSKGQSIIDAVKAKGDLAEQIKVSKQFDNLTGKITQGDVADIPKAQRALSNIEINGVKTYKDLGSKLDSKIQAVSSKVDDGLSTRPESLNFKDLTSKGHNFVDDALEQLSTYYEKINDVDGLLQIKALRSRAETQGLTIKEVNDLARLHGRELNGFNANGELASGLTKKAAENTRMGVKNTVRRYADDPVFEAADQQLADLIRTKDLVSKLEENVNTLKQRISERGLGEKAGRLIFQVADKFTGGGLKGFVQSFVPRGEGLKLLNALDLERGLSNNLKLLQQINSGALSEADMTAALEQIIKEGSKQKLLTAPKEGAVKYQNNVPINQPRRVITNTADELNTPRTLTIRPKYKKGGGKITQIFGE